MKALGVGLGAGVRRNMTVPKQRYHKYRARIGRFRRLRAAGVDTARLVRTGIRAMTYGSSVTGVPTGLLQNQRRTVGAMTAPGAGTGGQNLDLALVLADGGPAGKADPAFDAHGLPIGDWSMAVWESWEAVNLMQKVITKAKLVMRDAKNRWAKSKGPGAAYLLTCQRLGWVVVDATLVRTDLDELLDLRLDPPAVVLQRCDDAVRRWRWKRIELSCPKLAAEGSGRGPLMEPLWRLLKSKSETDEWNHHHRGGLRSTGSFHKRGCMPAASPLTANAWFA